VVQSIDHVVIAVRDLAAASADYGALGLTVTPGGEHTGGMTHNALISFADGAYFELIAFKNPDQPQDHRWWPLFSRGEGFVDFALLSSDLEAEAERLAAAGLTVKGPHDGGRLRPDGQRIAWRSMTLESSPATRLPFVIQDVTPRELRVPGGAATAHALGVTGVAGVVVAVADLTASVPAFAALLETDGVAATPSVQGVIAARRFSLGVQWIELVQPAPDGAPARHLAARGEVPYEIALRGAETAMTLPLASTHGARIRVESDIEL
jgi:catechol 2,3-dioxygenase-like lactoylglutathione lyase family enzyme